MRTLIFVVDKVFTVMYWLIIIRVILSWVGSNSYDPTWRKILKFIYETTEPILGPIRRLIPTTSIGFDFSPLIAIIVLNILRNFLIRLLYTMAF